MGRGPNPEQAQAFFDAIMTALGYVAERAGQPDAGAVLGALASAQAHFIAGVPNRQLRRQLQKQCAELLEHALKDAAADGDAAKVELIARRPN